MQFVYGSAIWAFLFAALSFYWALGGTAGAETLGSTFTDPEVVGDPGFVAFLWITAILKALLGLVPLAQVQRWGRLFPRWLVRLGVWSAGILLTLYGIALILQHGLMLAGNSAIPRSIGSAEAVRWHLFLWDPIWLVGGLLFLAAAFATRRPRA
jgi:hypothetical protein